MAATLLAALEPVPASGGVGRAGLRRVGDEEPLFLRALVHLRAGSKVIGRWLQPCSITTSGSAWPL